MTAISNHLRGATELMLVVDIKRAFVQTPSQLVSYGTRLEWLLKLLLEGRRAPSERSLLSGTGPIERLDTIFNTQWAVQERPLGSKLVVSAVFDSSFEAYFRNLQENSGHLLDAIFMHCEGYQGHTCVDDGYEAFARFIRKNQIQTRFFHSATPDLTVADVRYLRKRARGEIDDMGVIGSVEAEEALARQALPRPSDATLQSIARDHAALIHGMEELQFCFPKEELLGARSAREVYRKALDSLLGSSLDELLKERARKVLRLPDGSSLAPPPPARETEQLDDELTQIQGGILQPYNYGVDADDRLNVGCVLMVQCDGQASLAQLLNALAGLTTWSSDHVKWDGGPRPDAKKGKLHLNVSLTHGGLTRLLLPRSALESLPPEFAEGMSQRAGMIGDVGPHAHPSFWQPLVPNWDPARDEADARLRGTVPLSTIDVVLIAQRAIPKQAALATDHAWSQGHPLFAELHGLAPLQAAGVQVVHVQPLRRFEQDHFGLGEGKVSESQPVPDVLHAGKPLERDSIWSPDRDLVPLGELVLGYADRTPLEHRPNRWYRAHEALFKNGSFLVMRKTLQDVSRFNDYVEEAALKLGTPAEQVRARMLGRDPEGRTLVAPKEPDPGNDFDYEGPSAAQCPMHAHIRRSNPRQPNTPRIMRRSFAFGSPYSCARAREERGLMFMAYNTKLAEQFEVVQRWLSGANSTGLSSLQNDLITGIPQSPGVHRWGPKSSAPAFPAPREPFTKLAWGLYLFVPSRSFLEHAGKGAQEHADPLVERGDALIRELQAIKDPEQGRAAWKAVLEEQLDRGRAEAVWAALRAQKEPLITHYGKLIATLERARPVLEDDGARYSVLPYRRRLAFCFLPAGAEQTTHYIGVDTVYPEYAKLADVPNQFLRTLPQEQMAATAYQATSAYLRPYFDGDKRHELPSLRELVLLVMAKVSARYLGMPATTDAQRMGMISQFVAISRYCFQAWPVRDADRLLHEAGTSLYSEDALAQAAHDDGNALREAYAGSGIGTRAESSPLIGELLRNGRFTPEQVDYAVMGAIVGFAPPAIGLALSLVQRWALGGELARLREQTQPARDQVFLMLTRAVWRGLAEAPIPTTLYRKIVGDHEHPEWEALRVAGRWPLHVEPPHYAVIGARSIYLDARAGSPAQAAGDRFDSNGPLALLFGGTHHAIGAPKTAGQCGIDAPHGCPARDPAAAVLVGLIMALLEYPQLRLLSALRIHLGPHVPQYTQWADDALNAAR
jgi:deferrochelatase/peroxidase EfeB